MVCKICGKEVLDTSPFRSKKICSEECFLVDFWNKALDGDEIVVDGRCYHDGGNVDRPSRSRLLGHGGREFKIRMKKDSKVIVTNNLWDNGLIPKSRHVSDNAEFIVERVVNTQNY